MSTSLPVIVLGNFRFIDYPLMLNSSGVNSFYPSYINDIIGSSIIGSIQVYLGIHLGKKNVPNLLGEGVEQEVLTDIIKIMKKNPYLLEIKNEKAVFIGT